MIYLDAFSTGFQKVNANWIFMRFFIKDIIGKRVSEGAVIVALKAIRECT